MSSDLERIETKIAFLERANVELSDVIFRQHKEIQALRIRVESLAQRLEAAQSEDAQSEEAIRRPEDERPPHY